MASNTLYDACARPYDSKGVVLEAVQLAELDVRRTKGVLAEHSRRRHRSTSFRADETPQA